MGLLIGNLPNHRISKIRVVLRTLARFPSRNLNPETARDQKTIFSRELVNCILYFQQKNI